MVTNGRNKAVEGPLSAETFVEHYGFVSVLMKERVSTTHCCREG